VVIQGFTLRKKIKNSLARGNHLVRTITHPSVKISAAPALLLTTRICLPIAPLAELAVPGYSTPCPMQWSTPRCYRCCWTLARTPLVLLTWHAAGMPETAAQPAPTCPWTRPFHRNWLWFIEIGYHSLKLVIIP